MSRRTKAIVEPENHDRWLVSYADFITLLFAFFVVMYSISSVNTGKYRIFSESLDAAFSQESGSLNPIQVGEIQRTMNPMDGNLVVEENASKITDEISVSEKIKNDQAQLQLISEQIEEVLSPYIDQELIDVKRDDLWVEIEMKSGMLFSSGHADLSDNALPVLKKIAEMIRTIPNSVHVEGHTDDLPIYTVEFPSNWELSAARAASVVNQLMEFGVNPNRMAAIGYGEHHPIAENKIEQGRYKNRRVALVLLAQAAVRYKSASGERLNLLESSPKIPAGRSQISKLGDSKT